MNKYHIIVVVYQVKLLYVQEIFVSYLSKSHFVNLYVNINMNKEITDYLNAKKGNSVASKKMEVILRYSLKKISLVIMFSKKVRRTLLIGYIIVFMQLRTSSKQYLRNEQRNAELKATNSYNTYRR